MRDLLGGKGAGLAEMTNSGINVPPGFTISTEVCRQFLAAEGELPDDVTKEIDAALARFEGVMGRKLGDPTDPLLVSVRSGARVSMPGMMDTILNLGMSEAAVHGLSRSSGSLRFASDCYRRLIQMYGDVVLEIPKGRFEVILTEARKKASVAYDHELTDEDLAGVIEGYKKVVVESTGKPFAEDARDQLYGAICAVFRSWNNERAKEYRRIAGISDDWGTAVNVQAMVFGNLGDDCATGVAFTRNPATGEKVFFGEYLPNAQGEDVVAGIRTPRPLNAEGGADGPTMESEMTDVYGQLQDVREKLERHYRDMQDIEFTVEHGKLYLLQTRTGKRTGFAAVRIAVEMVEEGLVTKEEAVKRVDADMLVQLLAPVFDRAAKQQALKEGRLLAKGLNAGPGAACGRIVLSAAKAKEMVQTGSERVVLVRVETSPEDVGGMNVAQGILTSTGGMTSHAAVVARGMGKPCVAGCGALDVDYERGEIRAAGQTLKEGAAIAIDGTTGEVIAGELPTRPSEIAQVLVEKTMKPEDSLIYRQWANLLAYADEARRLLVRTNADTPTDAAVARAFGAEGIGLCRTEHMFFDPEEPARIRAMREMILADDEAGRKVALDKLIPFQRSDFEGIFRAMDGLPVTVRLLDPPLHEFLPRDKKALQAAASDLGCDVAAVERKVAALHEFNPMLGHRGCRLGISFPEIYEMQSRAIIEAAVTVSQDGISVKPEIMIPLVGIPEELERLRKRVVAVATQVMEEKKHELSYLVGTMIEVPRACLVADEVAEHADFFSFGTNDLTQMTFGFSRDDAGPFLQEYLAKGVIARDPFQSLDATGIGQLVEMAVHKGRATRLGLKVGVCGEHGGDPASVKFFHGAGLDYVSCSPYRVPIARLAAAQAVLEESKE